MTAWQNKPPLSRRQARNSARLHESEVDTEASPESPETDAAAPARTVTPGSGRRVQWDPSADSAEPLSDQAQSRLREDDSDASAEAAVEADAAESVAAESDAAESVADGVSSDDPAFRVRDFRPERRSSFAPLAPGAAQPWSPPTMSGLPNADEPNADKPNVDKSRADKSRADGWNRPLPSDLDAPERTMTRRELRMLRARALAEGEPEPSVEFGPDGVNVTTSSITVMPQSERDAAAPSVPDTEPDADADADVEPVADDAGVVTEEPVIPALIEPGEADHSETGNSDTDPADTIVDAETVDAGIVDAEIVDAEIVEEESPSTDAQKPGVTPSAQAAGSHPSTDMRRPVVPASEAIFGGTLPGGEPESEPESEPAAPVISGVVTPAATPFGHWSTQGDNAENAATGDAALSRNVGVSTGAITTHALVLPSTSESGDQLLAPLNQTGEIMITGSIDLPRSFGSTGAHPALFDHPEVDALIDEADRDDATAESAPVRAVRAVASNSSARAVIEAPAPRKSRLPLILGIVGGAVLLAAIVVIVTVLVINGV